MLNIALLGACPVQLLELATSLEKAIHALGRQTMLVTAGGTNALPAGLSGFDLVLLAGLEAPFLAPFPMPYKAGPDVPPDLDLEAADRSIRTALALADVSYRVLYGTADERLALALQAVESLQPPAASQPRPAARPSGLKSQPWVWMCDKCSDPQCEHRLLTALLAQRDSAASTPGHQARLY